MLPIGDITYESQLFRAHGAPQLPTAFVIRAITPPYGSVYSGSTNLTSDNLTLGLPENRQPLV